MTILWWKRLWNDKHRCNDTVTFDGMERDPQLVKKLVINSKEEVESVSSFALIFLFFLYFEVFNLISSGHRHECALRKFIQSFSLLFGLILNCDILFVMWWYLYWCITILYWFIIHLLKDYCWGRNAKTCLLFDI